MRRYLYSLSLSSLFVAAPVGGGSLVQEGSPGGARADGHGQMDGLAGSSCLDGGRIVCVGHDISVVQLSEDHFGMAFVYGVGGYWMQWRYFCWGGTLIFSLGHYLL